MEVSRNVLDFLGIDTSRIPEDVVPRLELQTEPSSWGVFVLIGVIVAIAALVIFFYQRELDTCPRPVKVLLGVFRFVVLLLMVLIFLGPEARWDEETDQIPYVVILRDASASMNV
ncbi:MAG: hypothetical protein IH991_20080, partial [Planctomycetes bacterium]|nr:hypothetical protein [Planctomycetota bacterium]